MIPQRTFPLWTPILMSTAIPVASRTPLPKNIIMWERKCVCGHWVFLSLNNVRLRPRRSSLPQDGNHTGRQRLEEYKECGSDWRHFMTSLTLWTCLNPYFDPTTCDTFISRMPEVADFFSVLFPVSKTWGGGVQGFGPYWQYPFDFFWRHGTTRGFNNATPCQLERRVPRFSSHKTMNSVEVITEKTENNLPFWSLVILWSLQLFSSYINLKKSSLMLVWL